MSRSTLIAIIGLISLGQSIVLADDVKKPQPTDKPAIKQVEKQKQPQLLKQADKTKQPVKQKPSVAILGNDAEYYTTSPAQGRPADGQVKAGTKVRVLEKAGSYARVLIQIEAYVPTDSLKPIEINPHAKDKAALLKKKQAAGKDAVPDKKKVPEKKPPVDKSTLKKQATPGKETVPDKKKAPEKKPAVDKSTLKKQATPGKETVPDKKKAPEKKPAIDKTLKEKPVK